MTLLEECIEALGNSVKILEFKKEGEISKLLQDIFPFISSGRIDWTQITNKQSLVSFNDILNNNIINKNDEVFIIWDDLNKPIIFSKIENIIQKIDDVTAVSFDTWILSITKKYVIEFYHNGEIQIGIQTE